MGGLYSNQARKFVSKIIVGSLSFWEDFDLNPSSLSTDSFLVQRRSLVMVPSPLYHRLSAEYNPTNILFRCIIDCMLHHLIDRVTIIQITSFLRRQDRVPYRRDNTLFNAVHSFAVVICV